MLKKTLAVAALVLLGAPASVLHSQDSVSDSARVVRVIREMYQFARSAPPETVGPKFDSLLPVADRVPGAPGMRMLAHALALSYYEDFDVDPRIAVQVQAIKAMAARLTPAERVTYAKRIVAAYLSQAKLQANALHVDSALATLNEASRVLPGIADSLGVEKDRRMYELVGKPAPALHADYWANGPAKPFTNNAPSVLMFTGEWCHSCRDAYPTIGQFATQYGSRGLQMVLAVELIGNFDGQNVTPDQEVADNRHYYLDEHHFTMPIAIQRGREGGTPPADVPNTQAFVVHYWPMFLVIDRHGVVRGILQGWDPYGSRGAMLKKLIEANL